MKKILSILLILSYTSLPIFAFDKNDLDITLNQLPLTTQLSKYYNGYEYNLTNKSTRKISIVNAQIINGHDGNVAFINTMNNEPSAMARTWVIAGPVGLFTAGIGWVLGLIATPIVAIKSNKNKKKTQTESIAFSNLLQVSELNSGESTTINSLIPIGSKPQLKLTIQDEKTKQLYSIVH